MSSTEQPEFEVRRCLFVQPPSGMIHAVQTSCGGEGRKILPNHFNCLPKSLIHESVTGKRRISDVDLVTVEAIADARR